MRSSIASNRDPIQEVDSHAHSMWYFNIEGGRHWTQFHTVAGRSRSDWLRQEVSAWAAGAPAGAAAVCARAGLSSRSKVPTAKAAPAAGNAEMTSRLVDIVSLFFDLFFIFLNSGLHYGHYSGDLR